mmetsp:Transcript_2472/g.3771  ORF Transcript_2472/g.3771 Transcript_2472/m.3771 type:complete len:119 (-) Transcript_2472:227-583(-)
MGVPIGPKLDFVGASETIITVSFNPLNSNDEYVLEWKEYHQKWETDSQSKNMNSNEMTKTGNGKIQTNIEGLNPGATYTVRLKALGEGSQSDAGKASPELIIDTEAVSCTPKPSCMIL